MLTITQIEAEGQNLVATTGNNAGNDGGSCGDFNKQTLEPAIGAGRR
jgi:hypothetical protein